MRCDATERPLQPRDASQPPLEPEDVMVYFSPRRNNRRLIKLPKQGMDTLVRIENPVPGEFAP
jgi:hypothetical protein